MIESTKSSFQIYSDKAAPNFLPLVHNIQNELCPELHFSCMFGISDHTHTDGEPICVTKTAHLQPEHLNRSVCIFNMTGIHVNQIPTALL